MPFKSLLTFHPLEEAVEELDRVIDHARAIGAHLDIVVMGELMSPPVGIHGVAPAMEWVTYNQEQKSSVAKRVEAVEQHVAEAGISANVIAECDYPGKIDDAAARYALCADVNVVTAAAIEKHDTVEKAFNGSLFDAGCPVLLLPEEYKEPREMSKIVLAWNGKSEASRAIRCAMPLIKNAEQVNIVIVDPVAQDVGEDPGSDLAAYLSRCGATITVDVLPSGGMSIAEKLVQRARDVNADIVVMGGYGHNKIRQWLLGGTTREILKDPVLPVFMVH